MKDSTVKFTLVDYKGDRYELVGLAGQRLSDASKMFPESPLVDDSNGGGNPATRNKSVRWTEDIFGEGPVSNIAHVVLPREWVGKVPAPTPHEQSLIDAIDADDRTPTSRLATEIVLTKDIDGIVVFVPDSPPIDEML